MTEEPERSAEPEGVVADQGDAHEPEISADEAALLAHREQLAAKMRSGANWFFWIAGLSIVNTAIHLSEGDRQYMVGLGITQVVNALAMGVAQGAPDAATIAKGVALVVTLFTSAVVTAFGFGARRGVTWLFVLGMVLYLLDGLLLAAFQDWMSAGFHAFALFCMYGGMRAGQELNSLDRIVVTANAD